MLGRLLAIGDGEVNGEACALAELRIDFDASAHFRDDAMSDRQPQTWIGLVATG